MNEYKSIIDSQIGLNKGANLFFEDGFLLKFTEESLPSIENMDKLNEYELNSLLSHAVNKTLEELYRVNQYYNFREKDKEELKLIYEILFGLLKSKSITYNEIFCKHSQNLKEWLLKNNAFSEKIYRLDSEIIEPVSCFEYTPDLQIEILQIDLSRLITPVLDIGCGQQACLVTYLRDNGIEAFGLDRFPSNLEYIENTDWIEYEYDYGIKKWGTIISNLGFSNHFMHHHLRADGSYVNYAKKYMQILNSLKAGGSFRYAPDLPFIEKYLDPKIFHVERGDIGHQNFKYTNINRLI